MTNAYGLDADYFIRLFARELNPDVVRNQTPECLARVLARAARTACAEVLAELEFQQPFADVQAEQQPVAVVDCGDDGFFADILPDRTVRVGQELYAAPIAQTAPLRYTNDGSLAECPCCGSLDVGGAHDTVNCYRCGLMVTKPRPLQNAIDAWNMRTGKQVAPQPEQLPYWAPCNLGCDPELNGQRSRHCAELCHGARATLSAQGSE